MLLKLVECLARLALPGAGPPSAEPGIGEAPAGFGELLFDQADSALVRPLGPGCGVSSLICFSQRLLSRRDGPAVLLLRRGDGLATALLLGFHPGGCPCGRPRHALSRGSGTSRPRHALS